MSYDAEFFNTNDRLNRGSPVGADASSSSSSATTIRANIARMHDIVMKIARLNPLLGGNKDTPELRAQLTNLRTEAINLGQQTNKLLEGSSSYQNQNSDWRIQKRKLEEDFKTEFVRLKDLCNQSIALEKKFVESYKARSSQKGGRNEAFWDTASPAEEEERASLMQNEEQRQEAIRMDNMIQYNENLIAERHEDVKQIERDVMEINEIFRDLAVMVNDQGAKIDQISDHIQSTADNTQAAGEEVDKAYESHKKSRKRTCILVLILLAAVIIVTVIIIATMHR